jgi:pimeloyl-ACP methyl ester carboxylesterase
MPIELAGSGIRMVAVVVAILISLSSTPATASDSPSLIDTMITVRELALHVQFSKAESPNSSPFAIVLESGIAARIGHWSSILPDIARIAPVIAYERPGIGESPVHEAFLPTPENVARTLRALLATMKTDPPFLLVGHSLGGVYVKKFADLFPGEVAAVVLIDPTDFNETYDRWCDLYVQMGVGDEGRKSYEAELDRLYGLESAAVAKEWIVVKELRRTGFAGIRELDSLRDIPVRVILGARITPKPDVMRIPNDFSFTRFQEVLFEHRHANFWPWLNQLADFRLLITNQSGHFVHQEQPELVLREIRDLSKQLNR